MPDYRRILFIKPSSLGDIVHAMPTLSVLRQAFPSAKITWLVKRQWSSLVERIDGVDRVWSVDPGFRGWLSHVPALRAERFEVAVDLQGLFRSAVIGWLSGADERIGFANAREGGSWLYSRAVSVPTMEIHAVDRYLLVAKALGATVGEQAEFRFRISPSDREEAQRLLAQAGVAPGMNWIALNVSARWPTKRWPAESFAATADRIHEEGFGPVVLVGGPDDRADVEAVKALMKGPAIDMAGITTVGLLPALLARAALFITNDSGPMHIAAAVGTPVVALFGPTSAVRTGPYGVGHRVLAGQVACSPCFSRSCSNPLMLECLHRVTPQDVMAAVRARLTSDVASR